MVNQHPANLVVVSLLLFWVDFTSGFVQFRDQGKRSLINVVGDFLFQQGLVQVELFDGEVLITRGWAFLKNPTHHKLRFWTFLNVWKNLIHFVWYDVSVLVLSNRCLWLASLLEWLVFFLLYKFIFFNFNCLLSRIYTLPTSLHPAGTYFAQSRVFLRLGVLVLNILRLKCSGGFFAL